MSTELNTSSRQWELLQHVVDSLRHPENSPYYGMPFQDAANILADKLEEVRDIDRYRRAMGII